MGWWSATIMGGDAPWDAEGDILELIGAPQDEDEYFSWEENHQIVKPLLEKMTLEQWNAFFKQSGSPDYADVCRQVAVVLHMGVGAKLPTELAEQAIVASSPEEISGWRNPHEREFYLNSFIESIRNYNGQPTEIASETLFEKIDEKLNPQTRRPH